MRGASKDVLVETERNLQDALHVARNIMLNPKLVPGGGAVEMAVSHVRIYSYYTYYYSVVFVSSFIAFGYFLSRFIIFDFQRL